MRALWQDVRIAARSLVKAPGFASLSILVLAAGIGITSVVFSLVDGALLRPLPFADPDRLVMLWEHPPSSAYNRVSPLNFQDWSEQNHVFSSMAAVSGGGRTITGPDGTAERVPGQSVTTAFFDTLGVRPIAGRTFVPGDAVAAPNVVVIGEHFWRTHLGGDAGAVGRTLRLDGLPFTVIGIMPGSFQVLFPADIWTPFALLRTPEQRRQHYLQVIARLKPAIEIHNARSDMAIVAENIARIAPDTNKNWTVTIEPLRNGIVKSDLRATSLVLAGVVALILLVACANVANLVLARGIGRTREIAVRSALGGSRGQILRFLMTESALVAAFGGIAGLAAAWTALRLAPQLVPEGLLPEGIPLQFDSQVVLFTTALTGLTAVLAGLAPAWHVAAAPLVQALGSGGRTSTRAGAFRRALAIAEVTAAMVLLSGAGLLVRTLVAMSTEDPGFLADSVLTMSVSLSTGRYPTQDRVLGFYRAVESGLAEIPGVRSVGLGTNLPLSGLDIGQPVEVVGDPPADPSSRRGAHYQMVSAGYFDTLGIRIVKGRGFSHRDVSSSLPVCVVNEELVRRFLHGRDPLDTVVKVPPMAPGMVASTPRRIVGVIGQVSVEAGEKEKAAEIYVPLEQNAWYWSAIAIKTGGDPTALAQAARAAIARADPDQAVTRVRTMADVAAEATSLPRFRAELVGIFALLALGLAAVGLFGVLAFSVRERAREFGIRMALGAHTPDILRLVLANGAQIVGIGVLLGLLGAAAMTRTLSSLLYGVTPLDPLTFLLAPAVLAVTALVACVAPTLRAVRTDPGVTLKGE